MYLVRRINLSSRLPSAGCLMDSSLFASHNLTSEFPGYLRVLNSLTFIWKVFPSVIMRWFLSSVW